jgi:hypothetical protein
MMPRTRLFLEMSTEWNYWVPMVLSEEDPVLLLRLLEYADVRHGISQTQLQEKLGLLQSRLSKLTAKLRVEVWVEDLRQEGEDGRVRRIRTARKGREAVKALEGKLSSLSPRPVRRRGLHPGANAMLLPLE